ncbi:hypothetical protein [Bdellovibrio sp. BCCA]|uniref:hypothetical protein n=1 Tax=Bdellovibrio sp. BCCA TaxID=3136281 RepID=UPI0030F34CAA
MENLKKMTVILSAYFKNDEQLQNSNDVSFLLENHRVCIEELRDVIDKLDKIDKPDNLDRAARLIQKYNPSRAELKEAYHKLARKELKKLAMNLGFEKIEVSSNQAGIASIGETTLMAMNSKGQGFSIVLGGTWSYARAIKHLKDHTGGRNHSLPFDCYRVEDITKVVNRIIENYTEEFR